MQEILNLNQNWIRFLRCWKTRRNERKQMLPSWNMNLPAWKHTFAKERTGGSGLLLQLFVLPFFLWYFLFAFFLSQDSAQRITWEQFHYTCRSMKIVIRCRVLAIVTSFAFLSRIKIWFNLCWRCFCLLR